MWRSGTSQLWAILISRLRERGKEILTPDPLTVPERAGQVLANRMAPAIICIAPSTSQRLHLARRCVSFRGIDHSWGNYLAAAVLLSTSLLCSVFGEGQGSLEGVEFRSRSKFFNTKLQPRQATASAEKCNATIGTKNIRLANHHLSPKPD